MEPCTGITLPDSPYAPPSADLARPDDRAQQSLPPRVTRELAATRKWMLAAGIFTAAAAAVESVSHLLSAGEDSTNRERMLAALTAAGTAALAAFPLFALYRAAAQFRRAGADGSDAACRRALRAHRCFWRRQALALGIAVSLPVIGILLLRALTR